MDLRSFIAASQSSSKPRSLRRACRLGCAAWRACLRGVYLSRLAPGRAASVTTPARSSPPTPSDARPCSGCQLDCASSLPHPQTPHFSSSRQSKRRPSRNSKTNQRRTRGRHCSPVCLLACFRLYRQTPSGQERQSPRLPLRTCRNSSWESIRRRAPRAPLPQPAAVLPAAVLVWLKTKTRPASPSSLPPPWTMASSLSVDRLCSVKPRASRRVLRLSCFKLWI